MLNVLTIRNFIIVEYQEITFHPGLNVITGETGTGKSLLINALLLLRGNRCREEWIRQGENTALVEACFDLAQYQPLQEKIQMLGLGGEIKNKVVISKEITRGGKNKTRLNGRTVSAQLAKSIASQLFDIYAQEDQIRFLEPENRMSIVDTFLSEEGKEAQRTYQELFKRLQSIEENLHNLRRGQEESIREYEEILQEMAESKIEPGKVEEIEEEFRRFSVSQAYLEVIDSLLALLLNEREESFFNRLVRIKGFLRNLPPGEFSFFSPSSVLETLERVEVELKELSYLARRAREAFSFSPHQVEELERDIDEIERLKRKYRLLTTSDLLSFRERVVRDLHALQEEVTQREKLEQEKRIIREEIKKVGEMLSQARKEGAQILREKVEEELKELAFRKGEFIPLLEKLPDPGPLGFDRVSFLVSLNPGELPLPVEEVASGGELSRIILAIKSVVSGVESVPTLVFDEIDQGIGGRTALWVGSKLRKLARGHQIICITHLPQIAAFAHHHLRVEKMDNSQKTWTQVNYLRDRKERIWEIARMMGDEEKSGSALEYAELLMEKVQDENP